MAQDAPNTTRFAGCLLAITVGISSCGEGDRQDGGDGGGGGDGAMVAVPDAGAPCLGCGPCRPGDVLSDFERTLTELPPASWYEAPGTKMRPVCVPDSVGVRGVVGCPAVVTAWSGGAYDSARRQLVLWGGGHADYLGNELYAFDLRTGTWSRLTEPTPVAKIKSNLNQDPMMPDGSPVSRHTYDGFEYIAHLDAFFGQGGSRASDGSATGRTWFFDLATKKWSMRANGLGVLSHGAAYDPNGRRVFVRATNRVRTYDIDRDEWSEKVFGVPPVWPRYYVGGDKTGAFDPRRNLFWSVGSKDVLVWDPATNKPVTEQWVTSGGGDYSNEERVKNYPEQIFKSGGGDVFNVPAPGFDYDPTTDAFVAWPNKGAPLILDLATKTWTVGSAVGAPVSRTSGGTFGRFRYVEAYNVFVLVTSVDENVYFYKHTAGCGPGT